MTQANVQAYLEDWLTKALEEELTIEYLEELAKDYEAIMDNYEQFGYQQQQQQGPYMGYNDQLAGGYYGYNVEGGESSQGEGSVDLTYLGDVAEEYIRLANRVESEEKNNLQRLYKLYLEKYKDVLQGQEDNQGAYDYPGGGNNEEEIAQEDNWRILQKLQKIKEDMQEVYEEHQNELEGDNENAFQSSETEMSSSEDGGESSDVMQEDSEVPVMADSVFSSVGESWGPIITETVTPSRIEELVPSETGKL